MPFTPAHVAAVLPLVRRTTTRPGWTAALVAGSMAPDLPYFVPGRVLDLVPVGLDRSTSHSLHAMFTTTAVLGVLAALAWDRVAEPVARDLLPRPVAGRLRDRGPRPSWRDLPAMYACTVVGVASHDLWDSFTHGHGVAVTHLPWLRGEVAGIPLWHLLQHVSSVVGLLVLAIWSWARLARRAPVPRPRRVPSWGRGGQDPTVDSSPRTWATSSSARSGR